MNEVRYKKRYTECEQNNMIKVKCHLLVGVSNVDHFFENLQLYSNVSVGAATCISMKNGPITFRLMHWFYGVNVPRVCYLFF